MFFNLSAEQIAKIKLKFYPQELDSEKFLKSVVVNDAGSDNPDNILKISFSIKDGASDIFKIFNNEIAKKYMRFKVFEILNDQMLVDVKAFSNIQDLENIINIYGALSSDLHPSYDFLGDKSNLNSHFRLADNSIELVYNFTFNIARSKIDFLSLGAIFYFDKQQYITDHKVEQQFIDERILYNKLLVYDLYNNNLLVESQTSIVQDLRLVKSVFKENGFLQNLLETINSDRAYTNLSNRTRQITLDKLSPTNISLEKTVSELKNIFSNKENLGKAKPTKTAQSTRKVFSNASYSRNSNLFLGFVFSMDYEFIIINNTPYPIILVTSDLKRDLLNECKISSISVLRRKVTNRAKNKYLPTPDTTTTIISSGEAKGSNIVSTLEDENGAISEIQLNTGAKSVIRSFAVTDKKLFADTSGLYQYGVEINISDGITKYLRDYANSLLIHIADLITYLEETNKIVTIRVENKKNVVKGSYDPQKNSFTREFINNFSKPRNGQKSFANIVSDSATAFEATLNLMGYISSELTSRELLQGSLTKTIVSLLNPTATSAESISFFIKIFEKLVNQINRIVKNNFNNTYKLNYWFTNDYVDSNTSINIGYRFIDIPRYTNLGLLNTEDLNNRIRDEVSKYSTNEATTTLDLNSKKYSFLSPNAIFSKNKILKLKRLITRPNSISAIDFKELEIDIKSSKDGLNATEKILYPSTNPLNNKIIDLAIKTNNFSKFLGLQVKNSFKPLSETEPIRQGQPLEKNDNANETNLMLALAKQFDKNTGKYRAVVVNNNSNVSSDELNADELPFQVNLLLEDRCNLLRNSENYKESLESNSKFQFLFNTLHSIEILEFANNMIDEQWSVLTREKIENLQQNNIYLLRIKSYKNSSVSIDGLEQIKLPVYDQYFFFKKTEGRT